MNTKERHDCIETWEQEYNDYLESQLTNSKKLNAKLSKELRNKRMKNKRKNKRERTVDYLAYNYYWE